MISYSLPRFVKRVLEQAHGIGIRALMAGKK
jgi:hypothetical protein